MCEGGGSASALIVGRQNCTRRPYLCHFDHGIQGRQAKVGPRGKVGHPHHSKSGECYGTNYGSF